MKELIQLDPFGVNKRERDESEAHLTAVEGVRRFWLLDRSFRKDLKNKQNKNEKNCKV